MTEATESSERRLPFDFEGPKILDVDGVRRTGTVWTASAHVITGVIGSGVLSLAWAMAQLGWIAGPISLILFAVITYYTSSMLADCQRIGDPIHGKRNYNYMDAVRSNLGSNQVWFCGLCQYINLFGTAIGYTITASISTAAVNKANCYHKKGHEGDCDNSDSIYIVGFGVTQLFFSQIPNFHKLWWLSTAAAVMSFTYSTIAVGLSAARVISGKIEKTTISGTQIGIDTTASDKMWLVFQALGNIAFAYSYSMILIEIQDTLKSPPAENKTMKRASLMGIATTTTFYMLCGCLGYIAFGNNAPGNILTGFGFYEPFWLIDFANLCIVVHLFGAYQVFSQPIFAIVEDWASTMYPNSEFLNEEYYLFASTRFSFSVNMFRLVWRSVFVILGTLFAVMVPFFNDVLALLGAIGFWPLTVYFPVEMYISQKKIAKFSTKWMMLETLSLLCFIVSLVVAVGSVQGMIQSLKHFTPFKSKS